MATLEHRNHPIETLLLGPSEGPMNRGGMAPPNPERLASPKQQTQGHNAMRTRDEC